MRFLFKILYKRAPSLALLPSSPSLLLSVVAEGASLLPPSCCQRSRVHWTHFALTLTLVGAKKYVCVACVASLKFCHRTSPSSTPLHTLSVGKRQTLPSVSSASAAALVLLPLFAVFMSVSMYLCVCV